MIKQPLQKKNQLKKSNLVFFLIYFTKIQADVCNDENWIQLPILHETILKFWRSKPKTEKVKCDKFQK